MIRKLLTGPDGTVHPAIEPVLVALIASDAAAGLNWVARARTQQMLAELAIGAGPVTHQLMDGLTPISAATHLRAILVEAAVLPARDERLIRLEGAVDRRIARVKEPSDRKILRSFATWHHLRRLRTIAARAPSTQDQVVYATNSLTAAASLLNWLHERGQNLATCTQTDIDDWLTVDPSRDNAGSSAGPSGVATRSASRYPRSTTNPFARCSPNTINVGLWPAGSSATARSPSPIALPGCSSCSTPNALSGSRA